MNVRFDPSEGAEIQKIRPAGVSPLPPNGAKMCKTAKHGRGVHCFANCADRFKVDAARLAPGSRGALLRASPGIR